MRLEIGFIEIPQEEISDLRDMKLHRYNKFNIELLEGKKSYGFKDHYSKDHTSTAKDKSATKGYV